MNKFKSSMKVTKRIYRTHGDKFMRKLFLPILIAAIILSLAACDAVTAVSADSSTPAGSVSLVDVTTEQGVSIKLPSDMPLQKIQGNSIYLNTETGDSAVFLVSDTVSPLTEWTKEKVAETYKLKYDGVVIKSFENGNQINGKDALVAILDLTTPKGSAVTMALVMITDGKKLYTITLGYGRDKTEGSLAINLQTCIESITIPE